MSGVHESLTSGAVLHDTYVLESPLGRGGMGAVWKARHKRLPRQLAIKVLHEHAYESEEILVRFRREAEITSRLGHPHIVEVSDFNVLDDGRAYLVMELLNGESLRERMKRGARLGLEEVMVLLEQVSSALAHAHRAGVVHRDLKPENVFLVAHEGVLPHAKVLDFGISKMQGAQTVLTQGGSLMGTPRYMSPEQAQGDNATVDGRADQFSLGCIAYELLAHRPAFAGNSVTQVLLQVIQENPPHLREMAPDAPPDVADAVMRALQKPREARFEDMDSFRRAVRLGAGIEASTPIVLSPRQDSLAFTTPDAYDDTIQRTPPPGAEGSSFEGGVQPGTGRLSAVLALVAAFLVVAAAGGAYWWRRQLEGPSRGGLNPPDAGLLVVVDSGPFIPTEPLPIYLDLGVQRADGGAADIAAAEPDLGGLGGAAGDAGATAMDTGTGRRPIVPRRLPPRLQGAQRALRTGDYDEAIRLARRSLREEGDQRAYALLAVAYCGKKDLGSARAMLREVARKDRAQVRRRCFRVGTELPP